MDEFGKAVRPRRYQDLGRFVLPPGFRGRSALYVQLWWFVEAFFFHPTPTILYAWRRFLLKLFGAKIGSRVLIRPSVSVAYPWKVSIGDRSWIGDGVTLYSLDLITIGSDTVISHNSFLCAAQHDPQTVAFEIIGKPISIGSECWLADDVFVAPGVTVGDGTVVGARSSVFKSLPAGMICHGTPARVVRAR